MENRICKLCGDGIEDVIHFLFRFTQQLNHIKGEHIRPKDKQLQCHKHFEIVCTTNILLNKVFKRFKIIMYK